MGVQQWNLRVKQYMEQYRMTEPGDGVLAAVSGGADSVCLLLILHALAKTCGFRLAAFHLNHGIRGAEADWDEQYVRELCGRLNVPLRVVHEDVPAYASAHGCSEEEAGRELRYRHLKLTAEALGGSRIATAHHRGDQIETVMLNLFRGSGLRGLGGIRPVRDAVVRPLLCMTREEIEAYLRESGMDWCEDSTNRENTYARNKVRNVLLPWLETNLNERAGEHVLQAAAFASQADAYFTEEAEKIFKACAGDHPAAFPIKKFLSQPDILKTYLIRAMIARCVPGETNISAKHIEAIASLTGPGGGTEVHLPHGLVAVRGYEYLEIRRQQEPDAGDAAQPPILSSAGAGECIGAVLIPAQPMPQEMTFGDVTIRIRTFPWKNRLEIPKKQYTKWFDYDRIKGALCVRTRESGDFIDIGDGKKKQLKRYFIDEKIPKEERGCIPLLTDGSHVLWIVGHRISESYKITDTTRTILEVQVCKGENHG